MSLFWRIWYQIWKKYCRFSLWFYYSRLQVENQQSVPAEGPVIFAVNHQNSFLDAIIVATTTKRNPYFLARADVFKSSFGRFWLKTFRIMPIYRTRDGVKNVLKNKAIFRTSIDFLKEGESILIFPEGNQSMNWALRPLQNGIARIAFGFLEETAKPVTIIPVGLQYEDHFAYRSRALVQYGEPLILSGPVPAGETETRQSWNDFLIDVGKRMSDLILDIQPPEDYERIKAELLKSRKYAGNLKTQLELDKEITAKLHSGEETPPGKGYPFNIRSQPPFRWLLWLVSSIPWLIIRLIIRWKVKDPQFIAPLQFTIGMILYPAFFLLLGILSYFEYRSVSFAVLDYTLILLLIFFYQKRPQ